MAKLTLTVNSRRRIVEADPDTSLLYVLRNDLGLHAAKFGCGLGQCGEAISYLGFNVGLRNWVAQNGDTVERFLAALSEADKWMRANPKAAAQVATRWIPGLKLEVAETAMQYNIQQADRRLSANNYRALWSAEDRLNRLGLIKSTFDVNKHIEPKYILKVMREHPDLFSDLPPIPRGVAITPDFTFKP